MGKLREYNINVIEIVEAENAFCQCVNSHSHMSSTACNISFFSNSATSITEQAMYQGKCICGKIRYGKAY